LAKQTFVCDHCEDEFVDYRCNREGHENIFCSTSCREDFKRKKSTVNWIHECEWCGDDFRRHPSVIYNHKFCSTECHHEWQRDNPEELHLWDGGTEIVECSWCGKEIERRSHRVEECKRHYCSDECMGNWRSENAVGEDAFGWRGGYDPYYGPNWDEQRRKALSRDEFECCDCNMGRKEHYKVYGKDLEVHHEAPFRTFDDIERANQVENLVTLCSQCHTEREHDDNTKLGYND